MSIINKTFSELNYVKWLFAYQGNLVFEIQGPYLKINPTDLRRIPRTLGVNNPDYWFPLQDLGFLYGVTLGLRSVETYERFVKKKWSTWGVVDNYNLKNFLTSFLQATLKLWVLVLPVMNDLYKLYIEKNHILMERDFVILDFWFESLPVLDELMLSMEEFKFKYKFKDYSTSDDSIVEVTTNQIVFKEVTEKNLESLKCENWNKEDFVNHIYKQFHKIDVNLLYQWLVYKNIPNLYENKKEFVYQYITNETSGLKSLSLSTLKLLVLNPLLDLDYIRELFQKRKKYRFSPGGPYEVYRKNPAFDKFFALYDDEGNLKK